MFANKHSNIYSYSSVDLALSFSFGPVAQMSIHALLNWRGDSWCVRPKASYFKGAA